MKEADDEQFLKRGPLAVLNVLKDLVINQTPILVSHDRGQFITRMLFADRERFILDYGSNDYENHLALNVEDLHVYADTHGAKVEFAIAALKDDSHDALPAFSAELPEVLWQIQRREFFRVNTPLEPLFYCYITWPDGSGESKMRVQDLSLGGIGVLAESALPEVIQNGTFFEKIRVEMNGYGRLNVDAELINIGKRSVVGNKNETVVTPRLSFRFTALSSTQERELQQVIFQLERLARDKANRFL